MTDSERSDSSDDRLPGELDEDVQDQAIKTWGLQLIAQSLPTTPDDYMAQVLAMYHEEWEKRTGEKWVIAGVE